MDRTHHDNNNKMMTIKHIIKMGTRVNVNGIENIKSTAITIATSVCMFVQTKREHFFFFFFAKCVRLSVLAVRCVDLYVIKHFTHSYMHNQHINTHERGCCYPNSIYCIQFICLPHMRYHFGGAFDVGQFFVHPRFIHIYRTVCLQLRIHLLVIHIRQDELLPTLSIVSTVYID